MGHSASPGFKSGLHWVCCDRCGFDYYHTEVREEWNGLVVCRECYEPRHPQDFVRGKRDKIVGDWPLRPCPPDVEVGDLDTVFTTFTRTTGTIDTSFTTTKTVAGTDATLTFTLGGVQTLTADGTAVISGDTSGFTATVDSYVLSSGSWLGEDAAGTLTLSSVTGTPQSGEQVDEDSPLTSNNVLTAGTYTAAVAESSADTTSYRNQELHHAIPTSSFHHGGTELIDGWEFILPSNRYWTSGNGHGTTAVFANGKWIFATNTDTFTYYEPMLDAGTVYVLKTVVGTYTSGTLAIAGPIGTTLQTITSAGTTTTTFTVAAETTLANLTLKITTTALIAEVNSISLIKTFDNDV